MQILGVMIVNTLCVFTSDAHHPRDGGAVRMGEFASLFEPVPARDMLHDAFHLIMGQLGVPEGCALQFAEFTAAGGAAEQSATSGPGVTPLAQTDIPNTQLAVG